MTRLSALLLALAALALGACGSDDDGGGSGAAATAASSDAFPVTVRSRFGPATIERAPRRVVTLDHQATDDALALGVTPVGIAKVTYVEGGMHPWTREALGDARPEMLEVDSGIPYEQIAALRPDLILAPHAFLLDEKAYGRLERIAPTVHFERSALTDDWRRTMERVGQALGQAGRARALVAETEQGLAEARKATPAFEGATINVFNADPSGLYTINDPQDASLKLMADLGMRLPARVAELEGESGRALISPERYDLLEADLLLGTSVSAKVLEDLPRDELFGRLGAVAEQRLVLLPMESATSMAFPSVPSVRFALREVVPQLSRAIGQRGA